MAHKLPWDRSRIGTLCPVCGVGRIKSARERTCSRACGTAGRADRTAWMAAIRKARAARHEKYLDSIRALIRADIEQLAALGRPLKQQDLYAFGVRLWRRAYDNGVKYGVGRERRRATPAA